MSQIVVPWAEERQCGEGCGSWVPAACSERFQGQAQGPLSL